MEAESEVLKRVMVEASRAGLVMWRNHVGVFTDKNGRYHRSGLCKGSSDLIGIDSQTGKFVAIEVKRKKGKATPEQINFIEKINEMGGVGFICDDHKKISELLKKHKNNN